jgi:hypothetical protein
MSGTIAPAGKRPAATTRQNTETMNPNGARKMQLMKEALSKVRMRWPQSDDYVASTEATRSARQVAMEARREAARQLGSL